MEFRLIYKGPLAPEGSSGGGRAEQKHLLRKWFHKQLRELWQQHPELRRQSETKVHQIDNTSQYAELARSKFHTDH